MTVLTQPLDTFINEQLASGSGSSEIEVEQMILSEVARRALDRKLAKAEAQIDNGEYLEANDDFINNLLSEARAKRHPCHQPYYCDSTDKLSATPINGMPA